MQLTQKELKAKTAMVLEDIADVLAVSKKFKSFVRNEVRARYGAIITNRLEKAGVAVSFEDCDELYSVVDAYWREP